MWDSIGQYSLYFGIIFTLVVFYNQWQSKDRSKGIAKYNFRLNIAAMSLIWLSYAVLILAFIQNDYRYKIVYQFSDNGMNTIELIMASWAQRQGVMILWSGFMTTISVCIMWYLRKDMEDPIVSRSVTILSFFSALIAIFAASPRDPTAFETGIDYTNGLGLNPALLSFWQEIHPPIAFLAYSAFIFPYASGIAALTLKKDGIKASNKIYWLNDFFMMLGWGLTVIFIVAGSIWGYEENWSGFWAWDPVEIASLVMFFSSTLYFHVKSHVDKDHPLRLFAAAMGWIAVVFSAFIVRGGLLEGLHTYVKSIENMILSFVFGFLLLGSLFGLLFAIRKSGDSIIPEKLYDWKNHDNQSQLVTFWALVLGIVINAVGLILQIINSLVFDNTNIPYDYYIVTNGLTLFTLAIVLTICELKLFKWSLNAKFILFGTSGLIIFSLFFFILDHAIFTFLISSILGTILLALILNTGRLILARRKFRKIGISLIHLSIILLILSYFTVDQSSRYENITMMEGEEQDISKFGISMIFTGSKRIGEHNEILVFIFDVIVDDKVNIIELTQGGYKGGRWTRGDWITLATRDYYFHLNFESLGYSATTPISIEVAEKPLANLFRLTFGFLIFITILGLFTTIKRRPTANMTIL